MVRASAALVIIVALASGGCGGAADQPQSGESVTTVQPPPSGEQDSSGLAITFRNTPDPPQSGDNAIEVSVNGPDGAPITDATVTTVFSMPAMPAMNMPAMRSTATLAHEGEGRYRGTGQLAMAGTWNVLVTVARGRDELGTRRFSVVAK